MSAFIWPSDADRAENEELNRVCEQLEDGMDERDALAAHVERLTTALNEAADESEPVAKWVNAILDAKPDTTSLTNLILIKQAEALEYAAKYVVGWTQGETLRSHAKELRRQAEEMTNQ